MLFAALTVLVLLLAGGDLTFRGRVGDLHRAARHGGTRRACAGLVDVADDLVSETFLAAMRGNGDAKRYRMEISQDMTRAEIAEAQRQAREWLSHR